MSEQYTVTSGDDSRPCVHRYCPANRCVGGDPAGNATKFFDELRQQRVWAAWTASKRKRAQDSDR